MYRSTTRTAPSVCIALLLLWFMLSLTRPTIQVAAAASQSSHDAQIGIVMWHSYESGVQKQSIDLLISEFNATNPHDIEVQGVYAGTYNEIYDQVISSLQKGELPPPNLVHAYPNAMADFARYDMVRYLDDYASDATIGIQNPQDFFDGVLDYYRLGEYGNQLAGLQHGRSIEVMYYDATLLAGHGLQVPGTWEAFESACISLTSEVVSGTIPGIDASRFATWLWSRGGDLVSPDLNQARFHEQPGIDSLQLFQDLIMDGYARLPRSQFEAAEAFGKGQVGFVFGSSAGMPYYRDQVAQGANHSWGVARGPATPGNEVVDSYGAGLGVLRHSESEDRAAWLFLRWLADREQTARWAALSGYFPVRASASTHVSMTTKLATDPQYAQAHDLLPLGRSEPPLRGYGAIRTVIAKAMTDILRDGADVPVTLQAAANEANIHLAQTGPESSVVSPAGGTLIYTGTETTRVEVHFPAGAVATAQTVSYVPLDDLPADGLAFALLPSLTLGVPSTVTIRYTDQQVAGMDEDALKLYNFDWAKQTWVDANPCGGYSRDAANNMLSAGICHFSDYILAESPHRIFMPLIVGSQ